jgi:catechol 2,3-dioxygenase-like lactoylglutathione lyase family enzyme
MSTMTNEADQPTATPALLTSNTIIYCDCWTDVVAFYRTGLGLRTMMDRDWFVEFELHPGAHVSVADASRATVTAGNGSGLTLSWRIDNIDAEHARLIERDIEVSEVRTRWGSRCFFVVDPAGNRIEFWAAKSRAESTRDESRPPR